MKCKVIFCTDDAQITGLCKPHYGQAWHGKPYTPIRRYNKPPKPKCLVDGCQVQSSVKELCHRHYRFKYTYGLTIEEIARLATHCAVCGAEEKLHIDHNHATGKVRGVLCNDCNAALGFVREDEQRLIGLIKYLRRNNG